MPEDEVVGRSAQPGAPPAYAVQRLEGPDWRATGLVRVARARSALSQGLGLLGRRGIAPDAGLWLEPCASVHTFCMRFAIDIAFMDAAGRVLAVAEGVPPWRAPRAPRGVRAVLEAPAGALRREGIAQGSRLRLAATAG